METLHWPLSVLSRAVHFKNLTAASAHVGLSQPQLSRLISQLEKELNVNLLDRSVKRKSAWTSAAFKLADVYSQSNRKLQGALRLVVEAQAPSHVAIGTLEGLSTLAVEIGHRLLKDSKIEIVEIDVFDQNELEQKFLNGDLDLVVTSRNPTRQKLKHMLEIGFQSLDRVVSRGDYVVMSSFEYGRQKKRSMGKKTLISNSLSIRQRWLQKFGGEGILPSLVKKERAQNMTPVLLMAQELFHDGTWRMIVDSVEDLEKSLR